MRPLDFDGDAAATYRELVSADLDRSVVSANAIPDKDTIWRVIDWLMAESSSMPPDLAEKFDFMLSDLKVKIRVIAYAVMRERVERIVEATEIERELMDELIEAKPFMSNADKVKLLDTVSKTIGSGMEQLDALAGVTDQNPDDILNKLHGTLKATSPFKNFTPEERERLRQTIDTIMNHDRDGSFIDVNDIDG